MTLNNTELKKVWTKQTFQENKAENLPFFFFFSSVPLLKPLELLALETTALLPLLRRLASFSFLAADGALILVPNESFHLSILDKPVASMQGLMCSNEATKWSAVMGGSSRASMIPDSQRGYW